MSRVLAERVAREAGAVILAAGRSVEQELLRDRKIRADREADEVIVRGLQAGSPYPILTEESGQIGEASDGLRWIVDPLDGSMNYSQGIPLCAVSIALWRGDEPVAGVVYDFNRDELFGADEEGAFLNGVPITVASPASYGEAFLSTGFPAGGSFDRAALATLVDRATRYRKVRLFGSAAISLAYLASGRIHAYAEDGIRLWDVAAGLALVRAAGGVIRYEPNEGRDTYRVTAGCCEEVLP
jgi:myo-inositol-1(or 4)-monophosphatase